jgi:hypothetical protein
VQKESNKKHAECHMVPFSGWGGGVSLVEATTSPNQGAAGFHCLSTTHPCLMQVEQASGYGLAT